MTSGVISGAIPSANLLPGQSCIFLVKAKVTSNTTGQAVNAVTVKDVNDNDETVKSNNTGTATVITQPACATLTVTPNFGDSPFEFSYFATATAGSVRLLDSTQKVIATYSSLS